MDDIAEIALGAVIGDSIGKIVFSDSSLNDNIASDKDFCERTRELYRKVGIDWNYNRSNYHNSLTC